MAQNQPSFSGFILKVAAAATAISVATMIVTLSMVNGFQHEVSEKVYSFWGHARVQNLAPLRSNVAEETPLETSLAIEKILKQQGITHTHAFASQSVVIRSKAQFEGVILKGVDASFVNGPFQRFITAGTNLSMPDSGYSRQILLSQGLANRLEAAIGDTLTIMYLRQGEEMRTRSVWVCGIYKTGISEYDQQFAIADIGLLQRLNLWNKQQIGGYELWLKDAESVEAFSRQLTEKLPQGIVCVPIQHIYPNIFDWLAIQNQTKRITIGVMLAVAAINLITCLLILVMERSRMAALLSSLGMSPSQIRNIFWYYAAFIAGVGVLAGWALGLGLLWLQMKTGFIQMDETTYYVSQMPVKIIGWQVLAVGLGSFAICVLVLRLPLRFLDRISIIRTLRFR